MCRFELNQGNVANLIFLRFHHLQENGNTIQYNICLLLVVNSYRFSSGRTQEQHHQTIISEVQTEKKITDYQCLDLQLGRELILEADEREVLASLQLPRQSQQFGDQTDGLSADSRRWLPPHAAAPERGLRGRPAPGLHRSSMIKRRNINILPRNISLAILLFSYFTSMFSFYFKIIIYP